MKMLKKWMLVAGVVFGAQAAAPANAQYGFPSPNLNIITNAVGNEAFARSVTNPPENGSPSRDHATNPALLRFTPNLATRQRNLAGFIAKTRAQSSENADQMAQMFASTDIFAAFAQGLAPAGLKIDNVADCYAAYWISAWEAANGIVGSQTSRTQAQAVKAQVSRALLSTPEFTKSSAAQKQELAEALLIQTALISASAEAAVNDPAQMEALGQAVRQGAKAMGLDLDAMTLGEAGFVAAK
jgi:hypothetical protein